MSITTSGIVCSLSPHGEAGGIIRVFTPDAGMVVGYHRGARGRALRPVIMPGNEVHISWHARTEAQLGTLTLELVRSRAHLLLGEPRVAAAVGWLAALITHSVAERTAYPNLYSAFTAWLDIADYADDPLSWISALVRLELLLLGELGFGLDLSCCAATGATDDLVYVSPRSAQAVSRAAGLPYHGRLLPLPAFILGAPLGEGDQAWAVVHEGMRLSGYFLEQHIFSGHSDSLHEARTRLLSLLPSLESSAGVPG